MSIKLNNLKLLISNLTIWLVEEQHKLNKRTYSYVETMYACLRYKIGN